MEDRSIWFKKEFLALVALVLVICFAWIWSAFKPVDLEAKPKFLYAIPDSNNREEALDSPLSLSVKNSILAVTDSMKAKVKFFYTSGSYIKTLEVKGGKYISAVAFDNNSGLYVSDLGSEKVYYYPNPFKNQQERTIFKNWVRATVIYIDKGIIYLSDVKNGQVLSFDESGKEVGMSFNIPFANGISKRGKDLYVTDSNNGRVVILNSKVEQIKGFSLPRGLAFDSSGNLHVVDAFSNNVKVLKGRKVLYKYGLRGSESQSFSYPNGIFIDKENNRIYVADKGNDRVQVLGW